MGKEQDIPVYKLFAYSDWLDKTLIFIGVLFSISSACLFPIIFYLYGQVAGTLVDLQNSRIFTQEESPQANLTQCFRLSIANTDYDGRIEWSIRYYVLVSMLSLISNYMLNVCFNTASERQIKRIRKKLFISILRQDMSYFDKNNPGEINSVITSNLDTLKLALGYKFPDFLALFGKACACTTFAIVTAWKFSTAILIIVPFIVISFSCMIRSIKKYSIIEYKAYGASGKIAQECLSAIRTIISFGMQKKVINKYQTNLSTAEQMSIKKGLLKGIFEGCFNGLSNIMFGLAVVYATYLARVECENYYAGNLIAAFFCLFTASNSLGQSTPFLSDLAQSKGAAKKIFEILNTSSSIDILKTSPTKLTNLKGEIEFKNVTFSYPQRPDLTILKGLSLSIPAGKTIAICGSSGSGKSTLISLLQRFYLPDSGEIKLDGHNIKDLNLPWLREQMALVSQEPSLFTTSIRENIRLGKLDATDEEIKIAAKNANAHDFIMATANKYDTQVGERGAQLSGGQKQRIAIARALLRNPKLLLLDEATSALDNESEKIVQEALDKASYHNQIGRTTIVIAHRLSTIRNADMIICMENGCVKESGTHDELMSSQGIYFHLVTSQTFLIDKSNQQLPNESILTNDQIEENFDQDDLNDKKIDRNFNKTACSDKEVEFLLKRSPSGKPTVDLDATYKKKNSKLPFYLEAKLWKIQRPELAWNLLGTVCQIIHGTITPILAFTFSEIYTIFSMTDLTEQLNKSLLVTGILVGLGVVNFVVTLLFNYSFSLSGARLTKRIRGRMFESMIRQEVSFHDMEQNRSSILCTKLAMSAPFCKGLTSDKLGIMCQGFAGVGFAICLSMYLNWKLCLLMMAFVPISFLSGVLLGTSATNPKVNGKLANEEGGRIVIETVENIRIVVSLGREQFFIDNLESVFKHKFKRLLGMLHLQAFFYSVSNSIIFYVQIAAFSFGYWLILNDGLLVPDLYRVYGAMTFSSLILGRVYSQMPDQRKAKDAAENAFKIIDRNSKIDSMSEKGTIPEKISGNIEFKNVCFCYPARPALNVLNNFNLKIKNGETNALVGPSGCGKSTVCSLLLRFYDISSGSILIDGVDVRNLNIQWLRSQIGVVSQEPVLFDYSIKENIENGNTSRDQITLQEVINAATQANINNTIENLPQKYDTLVGLKGSQLSGGEKQRIAIARALIRKPKILILDEATSALDTRSEQIVQDALDKASVGRTCIVIAHRLNTIQNVNKINVLNAGVVVEAGTHADLIRQQNVYFNLYNQK